MSYGTIGTNEVRHSLGKDRTVTMFGIFSETKQFSAYFEANKELEKGLNFGFTGTFDVGESYYNSFGLLFRPFKSILKYHRVYHTPILVCTYSLLVR